MNKEKLIKLKTSIEMIEDFKKELKLREEDFKAKNKDLLDSIQGLNDSIFECKEILTENAEVGYAKDGEKKRSGGIGIRVSKILDYDDNKALEWAKENMPVAIETVLNKKLFTPFAKENELDFVTKEDRVIVTFPKKIILEEDKNE